MLKKLKELLRRDPEQFRIPRSVQEVIPIRTVWKSGIFLVGPNRYSRTWQFSDINYALAGEEDQKSMLLGYSGLLNLCDSNASTKFSIVTRKLNRRDFEDYIMIPYANDGHDHYRREYNAMLLEKASHASGMIRDLYITVTITRKSYKDAESYFVRAGAEFTLALSRLGSRCTELDMMDRLRVLHGFYRHGEEADFHFDPALSMKLGHSFQDYICPDSFEFDRDHFRMGDRYGRGLFLKDYAAYLRDDILSELSGIDRPMILSIDVVPIPMDKAIRDSESRLLGVERNIVDFLRKQQANNNFSGTVPYDMEKQRAEMKEFLDDLTIRDQRMMLGMVTLVHTADSKATYRFRSGANGQSCRKDDAKGGSDVQGCGKGRCPDGSEHCQGGTLCRKSGYRRDKGCHCRYRSRRMGSGGNYPRSLRGWADRQFLLRYFLLRRGQRHGADYAAGGAGDQHRLSVTD